MFTVHRAHLSVESSVLENDVPAATAFDKIAYSTAARSAIPSDDLLALGGHNTHGASAALMIVAVIGMIIVLRLCGSVLTPFKEIVRASVAALGAVLLTGLMIVLLILAIMLSI